MTPFQELQQALRASPQQWLVTGAGGFIGSHLVETLLTLGQRVVGLDDFSTGRRSNLWDVKRRVGPQAYERFHLIEGDIRDEAICTTACAEVDRVLHQAALGSVPRSIEQPQRTHAVNVDGFVNIALAASERQLPFVYASSSSVYGDHAELPKREPALGDPLSPYAASKRVDEIYAAAFRTSYGLRAVGLRYFNVVGPRQDPAGAYAAVIPKWLAAFKSGKRPYINGDGLTSRDFCPVANVVQANLLAAYADDDAVGQAYNVGLNQRTDLNQLFALLRDGMAARGVDCAEVQPEYRDFRAGDVRHSDADVSLARDRLGYVPEQTLADCLGETMDWFLENEAS
ncbi:MAG: NAD-dependent epimerase/dehydratase family protein [Myxococcales bacterium]|nr:NAD-dependent epimerase/dehydratase family protein [Myxococcales bacterium]